MSGPAPRGSTLSTTPGGIQALATPALNNAVGVARDFGEFVAEIEMRDPTLADRVASSTIDQSLLGSKTVWLPPLLYVVSWGSTRLMLGLDPFACHMVALGLAYIGVLIGRWLSKYQVARILPAKWTTAPAPSVMRPDPTITLPPKPKPET